jgi:hypothetical protein
MDDVTMENDPLELLLRCTPTQQRVWKFIWNKRDATNHVATTQKEIGDALGISSSHVSTAAKGLYKHDMLQREGIHFYLNPHHWWYGEEYAKLQARDEWDKRKEKDATKR